MPTYEEQRDVLVPRRAYVQVPPSPDLPAGDTIEMPRLTLRRSLMLSRWIDDVSTDPNVRQKLVSLTSDMTGASEEDTGLGMIFSINSLISQMPEEKVIEFFCILTGKDAPYIEAFWEPGWGFEAIKVAFQQQGFGKMFQNAAENGPVEVTTEYTGGDNTSDPLEQVAPQPTVASTQSSI